MSEHGALVVGASSGVGRALAETLAAEGWDLVIASRTQTDLDPIASELAERHGVEVTPIAVDVTAADDVLRSFLDRADAALAGLDAVLIPAGAIHEPDDGTDDWATTDRLLAANLTGPVKLAGAAVARMEAAGRGTVVVFSSIAAAAPRRRNVAYGAAKSGLTSWGRSMRHRLADSPVAVQTYVLGYVDTAMTAGQDLRFPVADPADVARRVVDRLGDGSFVVHEPRWWRLIVTALRATPWFIYKRLRF